MKLDNKKWYSSFLNFTKAKKKLLLTLLQMLIIAIAFFDIGYIVGTKQIREVPKVAAVVDKKEDKKQDEKKDSDAEKQKETITAIYNPIDFDAYWAMNADVYAYIYIDDTQVDYPILQHSSDNSCYLNYMIDGTKSYPGSIYTEKENSKGFTDKNTIIYGHNMIQNGSMFNGITKYEDQSFFKEHPYIYIYTPYSILIYHVFAAYESNNQHLLATYNFNDSGVYQTYLNEIFAKTSGVIDHSVNVYNYDNIITLSTCSEVGDNRFLVQAVLEKIEYIPYKSERALNEGEQALQGAKLPD
ncbi:MAG: class B sortase [Erysipelotrichia bacterium]|nr:class B sortase [Erysipelotrichia bacterium]